MHKGAVYALLVAALFGASTPFAKTLVGQVMPGTLAGMLYLGSGIGLLICYLAREPHTHPHRHVAMGHTHAHYPDIHHRHDH